MGGTRRSQNSSIVAGDYVDVEEYRDPVNRTEEDMSSDEEKDKVTNIKDPEKFQQRIKDKLEMMVDPEDMHIFTVE